ncbi:hypothetical protein JCM10213_003261 [Rhodosporidiobolus nylandii]
MHLLSTLSLSLAALASTTLAAPTPGFFDDAAGDSLDARQLDTAASLAERAVEERAQPSVLLYFPAFSEPRAGSTWMAGGMLRVAWNTTKPYDWSDDQLPKYATVRLGYTDEDSVGYHLDVAPPLGNITYYSGPGTAYLPLPDYLETRSTYFITAGSTSVTSARFTIEAVSSGAGGESSSSSSTAPPAVMSSTTQQQSETLRDIASASSSATPSSSSTAASTSPLSTTTLLAAGAGGDSPSPLAASAPSSSSSSSQTPPAASPSSPSSPPSPADSSPAAAAGVESTITLSSASSSSSSAPSPSSSPAAAASGNVAAASPSAGTSGATSALAARGAVGLAAGAFFALALAL